MVGDGVFRVGGRPLRSHDSAWGSPGNTRVERSRTIMLNAFPVPIVDPIWFAASARCDDTVVRSNNMIRPDDPRGISVAYLIVALRKSLRPI
jgi:hypothetical protein